MSLTDYNGKEVFIVNGEEDDEASELFVTDSWDALLGHMKVLSPEVDSGVRVFHGILATAEYLPKSFKGKSVFIVCKDPLNDMKGYVVEGCSDSPEELAEDITSVVREGGGGLFGTHIGIDDIYLLYGYQIQTCLSVDEEELDEEIIYTSEAIFLEVEKTAKVVLGIE